MNTYNVTKFDGSNYNQKADRISVEAGYITFWNDLGYPEAIISPDSYETVIKVDSDYKKMMDEAYADNEEHTKKTKENIERPVMITVNGTVIGVGNNIHCAKEFRISLPNDEVVAIWPDEKGTIQLHWCIC